MSAQSKELENRRYHSYSDFDQTRQEFAKIGKLGLAFLILRELPLRHMYARSAVGFFVFYYLIIHNWKLNLPGWKVQTKALYYTSKYDENDLANYPMFAQYATSVRPAKKNNPGLMESDLWYESQYPAFYMHHFKSYRYIFRNRRVVPWDGTFNQPIFPYTSNNDRTNLVHNNTNEIVECKASGNF
jgi:hypothetical protein